MAEYIVKVASEKKRLPANNGMGEKLIISLEFESGERAEWKTIPTTTIPATGAVLDGTLEDGPYGKVFKKTSAAFGGGGGEKFSPETQKRIIQQATLKVAIEYCKAKVYLKKMDDFTVDDVCKIAHAIRADVEKIT